jgi:hypothetical protein
MGATGHEVTVASSDSNREFVVAAEQAQLTATVWNGRGINQFPTAHFGSSWSSAGAI